MKHARDPLYRRHRFPADVISYAVWLYFRFPLSLRMVEEMLAARGIDVSHESVRHWAEKFGRQYSNRVRRPAPARGDKWHMDEIVITIRGRKHWLWRVSIRMASFSTFSSKAGEIELPRSGSCASFSRSRQERLAS
jgi:putative transposase